jgi:hypothetical protein
MKDSIRKSGVLRIGSWEKGKIPTVINLIPILDTSCAINQRSSHFLLLERTHFC